MAENRKAKDKRFYFSRGQLILMGGGFAVVSVIVFLLGMLVGQSIEERKIVKPAEPLVKIPVKPLPQGANAATVQPREEMTFYDTLTKPANAPAHVEEPPKENKKTADKIAKAELKESKVTAREDLASKARKIDDRPAEAARRSQPMENSASREASKSWTVQVNAFPDETSAKSWVDKLKAKGYNAFLTEVRNNGKLWYRVRVGRFNSREEAEKVEDTLKNKENFANSFATSK